MRIELDCLAICSHGTIETALGLINDAKIVLIAHFAAVGRNGPVQELEGDVNRSASVRDEPGQVESLRVVRIILQKLLTNRFGLIEATRAEMVNRVNQQTLPPRSALTHPATP